MRPNGTLSAAALFLTLLPSAASGQKKPHIFHRRYFVSYETALLRNVLIYSTAGDSDRLNRSRGTAFGVGISFAGEAKGSPPILFQLAYDRASVTFTDSLVSFSGCPDRFDVGSCPRPRATVALHSFDVTFGYVFRGFIPVVPLLTLGAGVYHQQPYPNSQYAHYNKKGLHYPGSVGLGLKVGFLRHFALTGVTRGYWEKFSGPTSGCSGNVCVIYEGKLSTPPALFLGRRTSVGLQWYFGNIAI